MAISENFQYETLHKPSALYPIPRTAAGAFVRVWTVLANFTCPELAFPVSTLVKDLKGGQARGGPVMWRSPVAKIHGPHRVKLLPELC